MHGMGGLGVGRRDDSERGFQHIKGFLKLRVSDDQRHQDANYIAERSSRKDYNAVLIAVASDLVCYLFGGFACARLNEFDGAHSTEAAHITDNRPSLLPCTRTMLEMAAKLFGALREVLPLDGVDHGEAGSA